MEHRHGIWYGVTAYIVWGLSPLFWNLIDGIATIDLLAHRTLWAVPLLAIALTARRAWTSVSATYRDGGEVSATVVSAILLSINWGVYLWAVTHDQVVEASLGYFINPLVSVALGVLVLGERLRRLQWAAVGIAGLGVAGMAIRIGALPWVSLALAFSFGFYGLMKKRSNAPGPLVGLFGEVAVLSMPALAVILFVDTGSERTFFSSPTVAVFLIGAGAMTVVPLLLFGAAAKRIPLTMVGLLQYIAPTLQFVIGITVLDEVMSVDKLIGFVFVWIALAIYSFDSYRGNRYRAPAPV